MTSSDARLTTGSTPEQVAPDDRHQSRIALLRYHGQGGEVAVGWIDDAGQGRGSVCGGA